MDYKWGLLSDDGPVRGPAMEFPSLFGVELYGCAGRAIVTDTPLIGNSLQARFLSPDGTASESQLLGWNPADGAPSVLCMRSGAAITWREWSNKTKDVAIHVTLVREGASPADLVVARKRVTGPTGWGYYYPVIGQTSKGGAHVAWTEGRKGRTANNGAYDVYSQSLSCPVASR
jgi:hypothetical protein